MAGMKTTLEMPALSGGKSAAAQRGIPLRQPVSQAVAEKLTVSGSGDTPWMTSFGKLRPLRKESARIDGIVNGEFEKIELEDRE